MFFTPLNNIYYKFYLLIKYIMKDEQSLLMFYHTTIRNVGLYTSISFAALGYSRFYRGKNKLYNVGLILFSLAFLIVSLVLDYFLILDINYYKKKHSLDKNIIDKWMLLTNIILIFNIGILFLGLNTLYNEITN
jgi:hypothetical protein